MGFINQAINDNSKALKASIGTECKDCSKAVAGMESAENPQGAMSSREEGHADQAVTKEVGDNQYVLMDSAVGNLFTKALQVKFANGEHNVELNTARPANESAAMDTMVQAQAMRDLQLNPNVLEQTISNLRISKATKFKTDPVHSHIVSKAIEELAKNDIMEFVVIKTEDGDNVSYPLLEALKDKEDIAPGMVPGIRKNDPYRYPVNNSGPAPTIAVESLNLTTLPPNTRIKSVKVVIELAD